MLDEFSMDWVRFFLLIVIPSGIFEVNLKNANSACIYSIGRCVETFWTYKIVFLPVLVLKSKTWCRSHCSIDFIVLSIRFSPLGIFLLSGKHLLKTSPKMDLFDQERTKRLLSKLDDILVTFWTQYDSINVTRTTNILVEMHRFVYLYFIIIEIINCYTMNMEIYVAVNNW